MNGHFDYTQSPSTIITNLKALGMKTYRCTWEGDDTSLNKLVALASAFKTDNTGIMLYVCLDVALDTGDGTTLWPSELAAYNYAKTAGAHVASTLAPYASNILAYECGNELCRKQNMATPSYVMGTWRGDFDNAKWPILRGVVSGALDGVKSVNAAFKCASNAFTFAEIAASDMLWNGMNPDGTTGYRQIKWDITAWHAYHSWGDPFNIFYDGPGTGPRLNLIEYVSNAYGVPIVISEWNADADDGGTPEADKEAWVTARYYDFYYRRYAFNIAAVMFYALYSSPWNLLNDPADTLTPMGTKVKAIIASYPDT